MLLFIFTPMIFSFAFTFGLFYLKSYNTNKQNILDALPLTPDNTMVVFDLHGVLFNHKYFTMIKTFLLSPLKWKLIHALLNPRLIWDLTKLLYRRPVPESFFVYLARNYKNVKEALPLLIEIANKQEPNLKSIDIVCKLKKQGYELAILSNIGQRIFNDLEPKHHKLFHLFDHIVVATPETHYISKPNPKIYQRLLDETGTKKNMILIDDKEKNICGGLSFGIIGITFKNAQQLTKRLKRLQISV